MIDTNRVLIVDDDNLLRNLFGKRLEHAGYHVMFATDGDEGFEMAQQHMPDVILLDYQMPKMNGDEMLIQLRNTDWGESIPVIMMSAVTSLEEVAQVDFANAVMYKPITNRELLTAINDTLSPA